VNAAEVFDVKVVRIPKSKAGADIKAPSVYLDDQLLAEIGGLRDGLIKEEDMMDELEKANVPKKQSKGGFSCSNIQF
jgi:hypothetical protein